MKTEVIRQEIEIVIEELEAKLAPQSDATFLE